MIIIFVLGIIAMIMILGLTFLTTATLEKKAAINYNNSVKADFTAKTALNRAIQLIKIYSVSPLADYSHIMSFDNPTKRLPTKKFPTPTSLTQKEYDILTHDLEKMSTTTNGIEYNYDKKDNEKPLTWIYLRDEVDGPIVSRMAFIVIPPQTPKSPEAYWIDGDGKKKYGELYHRFNLARTDWDNFSMEPSLDSPSILNPPVLFSEKDPDKIKLGGIPWLKNWKSKGSFKDSKYRGNQIIANLIDYSDGDDIATTDFDPTQPIDYTLNPKGVGKPFYKNAPTYVGLEKVPYINEVQILFDPMITTELNPNKKYYYTIEVDMSLNIESIYMYKPFTSGNNIQATMIMKWKVTVKNKINNELSTYTYITTEINNATSKNIAYNKINSNVSKNNTKPKLPKNIPTDSQTGDVSFDSIKITSLTVKLEGWNSKTKKMDFYDFAYIVKPDKPYVVADNISLSGLSSIDKKVYRETLRGDVLPYFNAQVNDPRQNLDLLDWEGGLASTKNFRRASKRTNSLGSSNVYCEPSPNLIDKDYEIGAKDPWDVSTAYIRNAPMKSPWELGFIHRGEKWQTINLKKFNTAEGVKDGAGGDAYSEGDANILNQVKMTNDLKTYGKININSDNIGDLTKLFEGIYVGSLKDTTNKDKGSGMIPDCLTTDEINSSKAEKLATRLSKLYDKKNPFKSRAEILSDSLGNKPNKFRKLLIDDENGSSLDLNQDNNAEQEEIIGKFINKATTTTSNSGTLNIIAMGESIKDLGDVTINGKKGTEGVFDIGVDKILASQKIFAVIGSREDSETANKKVFYIQKFKYID